MASINDILNKYRARNQAVTMPPTKSMEQGGVGTVRRDIDSERIAQERQIAEQTGAAALSVDMKLMDAQRKQTAKERDEQIIQARRQSREERQRYQLTSGKILDNLEASHRELTSREKIDQMETAASQVRLSNEKYRYELADRGRRLRLDDAQQFDTELKKSIFDENLVSFRDNIEFQRALDLDEDKWARYLGELSIEDALEASKGTKPSQLAQVIQGVGTAVSSATSKEVSEKDANDPEKSAWAQIKKWFTSEP